MYIPHFVYPFTHRWTFGLLTSLALWTSLLWTWVYKYPLKCLLSNFENIPRSGTARQVLLLKIQLAINMSLNFLKIKTIKFSLWTLTAKQLFYSLSLYALKAQVKNKSTFHTYDGKVSLPIMPVLAKFPLAKCITL